MKTVEIGHRNVIYEAVRRQETPVSSQQSGQESGQGNADDAVVITGVLTDPSEAKKRDFPTVAVFDRNDDGKINALDTFDVASEKSGFCQKVIHSYTAEPSAASFSIDA